MDSGDEEEDNQEEPEVRRTPALFTSRAVSHLGAQHHLAVNAYIFEWGCVWFLIVVFNMFFTCFFQ